jgi:hypothetical protein
MGLAMTAGVLSDRSIATPRYSSLEIRSLSSTRIAVTLTPPISEPNSFLAFFSASPKSSANKIPPALPLLPDKTCAFNATGFPSSLATSFASEGVVAILPFGMGMPTCLNISFALNSGSFRSHSSYPWFYISEQALKKKFTNTQPHAHTMRTRLKKTEKTGEKYAKRGTGTNRDRNFQKLLPHIYIQD